MLAAALQQGVSPCVCPAAPPGKHNSTWLAGLNATLFLYQVRIFWLLAPCTERTADPGRARQHTDPKAPHYFNGAGNEAGCYLQFMIDYYDCLPEVSALKCSETTTCTTRGLGRKTGSCVPRSPGGRSVCPAPAPHNSVALVRAADAPACLGRWSPSSTATRSPGTART